MTTKIPVELSSTPGIVDGSNATAITINSSEQVMIGTTDAGYPDYGDSLTVADVDGGDYYSASAGTEHYATITAIIPNNIYYKLSESHSSLVLRIWAELR